MSSDMVIIPDRISTLDLSKIWLQRALQELQQELEPVAQSELQEESEESEE